MSAVLIISHGHREAINHRARFQALRGIFAAFKRTVQQIDLMMFLLHY